jgi:CDP-glycerol glycerophosphotransferase (TagB/SpsB family)
MLSIILSPVTKKVKRKSNIWVFGSFGGRHFTDSPKYFMIYLQKVKPEIRTIWLTNNKQVVDALREQGYESYQSYSLKGFFYTLKAGFIIVSTGIHDVNIIGSPGAKIINTWHGIPIKKIQADADVDELDVSYLAKIKSKFVSFANRYEDKQISSLLCCSKEEKQNLTSAFRINSNRVHITGLPRNDILYSNNWTEIIGDEFLFQLKKKFTIQKVFLYLPTYRDSKIGSNDLFYRYGFEEQMIQTILESQNAILVLKMHYLDQTKLSLKNQNNSRIIDVSNSISDIYPILKQSDILITDYSSIYLDYLLIDKPIIFSPFDLEEYVKYDRKLYYDYDEITPGPKAKNWFEVFELIKHVMEIDEWKLQRELIRNRFHQYKDGNSAERVFQMIVNELKSEK